MNNRPKPYFDADGKPIMEQSVVVLADILGYKERMRIAKRNGREQEELTWLSDVLDRAYKILNDPSGEKWKTKTFSDNVLVGYRYLGRSHGEFELGHACYGIGQYQLELARDGLFIRGGIGIGSIHISDTLIYGHILSELSKLEQQAKNPRVILHQSAVDYLDAHPEIEADSQHTNIVRTDDDNVRFINYMYPILIRRDSLGETMLLDHKRHIEFNLDQYRDNPDIFKKYIWAAKYHNLSCRQSRFYNDPVFLICI